MREGQGNDSGGQRENKREGSKRGESKHEEYDECGGCKCEECNKRGHRHGPSHGQLLAYPHPIPALPRPPLRHRLPRSPVAERGAHRGERPHTRDNLSITTAIRRIHLPIDLPAAHPILDSAPHHPQSPHLRWHRAHLVSTHVHPGSCQHAPALPPLGIVLLHRIRGTDMVLLRLGVSITRNRLSGHDLRPPPLPLPLFYPHPVGTSVGQSLAAVPHHDRGGDDQDSGG
mmetsp:Transcript_20119/g.45378  ORF Transcript_20119/g.45378 Transcript_20119/m.45378 type:complete len:229 (-) Transcript_20119:11-697(-)